MDSKSGEFSQFEWYRGYLVNNARLKVLCTLGRVFCFKTSHSKKLKNKEGNFMEQITGLDLKIKEMASRIRTLRESAQAQSW